MIYPVVSFVLKYRWLLAVGTLVPLLAGSHAYTYYKGKSHERAAIAQEQVTLISKAQQGREATDDKVRKMDDTAINTALRVNGWLRPDNEL